MEQLQLQTNHTLEFALQQYGKALIAIGDDPTSSFFKKEIDSFRNGGDLTDDQRINVVDIQADHLLKNRQRILIDRVRFGSDIYKKIPSFWHNSGMLDSFVDQHDNGKKLSEKQLSCLIKMIKQTRENSKSPKKSGELPNIKGIYEFLNNAKVKFPKIWLKLQDGTDFRINRAGSRSKYDGQLQLSNGVYGDDGLYFGRIDQKGSIYLAYKGKAHKDEILALLVSLVKNPEEIAKEYGRLTGNCCFCHKELSTDNSLEVGYGPICADNFNLKWGNRIV
tara:strand:+ start:143 stop:976 length:834 start_codon:yes stop_codon:yes gene_type:complete